MAWFDACTTDRQADFCAHQGRAFFKSGVLNSSKITSPRTTSAHMKKTKSNSPSLTAISPEGPLYKEVRRQILDRIAKGEWKPGERLPSEPELAKRLGVGISTIRAGVGDLCAARVLNRIQGKGTFVARHDLTRHQYYFSNVYDRNGQKAATAREIISVELVTPDDATRATLALEQRKSQKVFVLNALLRLEGDPFGTMTILLPEWLFPRFRKSDLAQTDENIYSMYQRKFGVTVLSMDERVYAGLAGAKTGRMLKLAANEPVMHVDRVTYTFNDVPVEVRYRSFAAAKSYYQYRQKKLS
jgi:GntR family transcriptional regulator